MKNHRDGGKYGGNHTTFIDVAGELCDSIYDLPEVTRISPGIIRSEGSAASGMRKVKIADSQGCIVITCRMNRSVQEIRIYSKDPQSTKLALARLSRSKGLAICFGHSNTTATRDTG